MMYSDEHKLFFSEINKKRNGQSTVRAPLPATPPDHSAPAGRFVKSPAAPTGDCFWESTMYSGTRTKLASKVSDKITRVGGTCYVARMY